MVAADLPDLHPLLAAREQLRAFSTLFHGGEEIVMVRLLVLRAIGGRGDAPDWSPQELREHFAYLDPVKFDTVIGRLRDNGLLLWDAASQRYRISPVGRQALAAIGLLVQFNGDGDALAYVTAQLAAGQSSGRLRAQDLQHLLSRLNELREDFDQAVLSGSEHRIQAAAETLQSVWQWVEKGTAVIEKIAADADLDAATHRVAQQIGRAQSAMLRQASVFQRALNQLDRHRVHLGASGLSSSDVNRYLRELRPDALAGLLEASLARGLSPALLHSPILLDVAEYELVEREREAREDQSLPGAASAPELAAGNESATDYVQAAAWLAELDRLDATDTLARRVPSGDFATSAYRFSLLGLIGDPGAENRSGISAGMARLPLRWRVEPALEPVGHSGVASISRGLLQPFDADAPEGFAAGVSEPDAPGDADTAVPIAAPLSAQARPAPRRPRRKTPSAPA